MKNSNHASGGKNAAAQDAMNVMVFENPEFGRVRTMLDENGEPLFCGKDVCDALGYARTDNAVRQHVNTHDALKQCVWVATGKKADGTPAHRRTLMLFVNESGFYSLVLGSKLESALRFKHWVTSEVLPAIRKNGGYFHINPGETMEQVKVRFHKVLDEAVAQRDAIIAHNKVLISQSKALIAEQTTRIRELDKTVGEQMVRLQKSAENILFLEENIDHLQPKALYSDNVLDSISCYTTTQIAKELGLTAQELNRELCARHVQYYQSGQYMLYAAYAHQGLAKSRTHFKAQMVPQNAAPGEKQVRIFTQMYLVWTERGRKLIHDLVERRVVLLAK